MALSTVEEAIEAIGRGEMVVVVDDEDRENEGDLVMAAQFATPEAIAFFLAHTSGVICVPLMPERIDELELPLMVVENTESQRTAFTVTVDYRPATTTGISAGDRSATIRALIDAGTKPADLARPGHIFPLRYRTGGVLKRAGHTEATVDLARMAGCYPAGVLCEIVTEDKRAMARLPELERFAADHGLAIITIADLVRYRRRNEKLVQRISSARIPTKFGDFTGHAYQSLLDGEHHFALVRGDVAGAQGVLVRVHSECLTGDVFGSRRCDCQAQLHQAMAQIAREGSGLVVYLRQEGRGIGLMDKLRAYALQDQGLDTVEANLHLGLPADGRDYQIGSQIISELGVRRLRVMSNNPHKYYGLQGHGLDIVERVPIEVRPNHHNSRYLATKRDKLGHLLTGPNLEEA